MTFNAKRLWQHLLRHVSVALRIADLMDLGHTL
jgi:hypothetical protein